MLDLDRAMQLLASRAEASGPDPGEQVRSALLRILAGLSVPGLTESEAAQLHNWCRREYGDTADPAGALYQAMLSRVVRVSADGTLNVSRERGAHRATGAYYTEDVVVRYMLRRAGAYMKDVRTVIDPACGNGAFLTRASEAFPYRLDRLTGLDSDGVALEACRRSLPGVDLRLADSLLDEVPGGYDLCVGNPPYISSGLRGAAAQDHGRLQALKEIYPSTAQYKLNTYPLFVERGLRLVREGGLVGYIVPDSFLSGRYFAGLRRLLLENTLLELTLIREDFWKHGRVGQSVILFVRRGRPAPGHRVLVKVCRQVSDLDVAPASLVPLTELAWGPLLRFPLIVQPEERLLARVMESAGGGATVGQLFRSYSGLIGKRGQRSLLRSANPGYQGPCGRLLRSGREIDRYRLSWAGEEVCLDPSLVKSGGCLAYYKNPKILLRQTSDSIRAVYDEEGYFCLNNIHLLVPKSERVPARALLGLINSGPVTRFYRAMTMETGRLYPQVDLDLLETLPLPRLDTPMWENLTRLVANRESAAPSEAAHVDESIDRWVERAYGIC